MQIFQIDTFSVDLQGFIYHVQNVLNVSTISPSVSSLLTGKNCHFLFWFPQRRYSF